MRQKIYIALVDDWELRGTGAGDVEKIQSEPMAKLMDMYERCGVRGTFNVEVMQQLYMKKLSAQYKELKRQADAWERSVLDAHRRGHDIQLHIHIQWHNASYDPEKGWTLNTCWDVTKYPEDIVRQVFSECIAYLHELFRDEEKPLNLVSFRSGAWCIAPSDFILDVLADNGIKVDISLVAGIKYDTAHCRLDYTNLEENFLPFYPNMKDARKVSAKKEPLVCIPTFSFWFPMPYQILHIINKLWNRIQKRSIHPTSHEIQYVDENYNEWGDQSHSSALHKIIKRISGRDVIADLSQFSSVHMGYMRKALLKKARESNSLTVPLILENHTKDISDFSIIERFVLACKKNRVY